MQPVPDEASRPPPRHTRTASAESDFGSFVSVPSAEHPLHPQEEDGGFVPFTPTHDEFFDKFTEDAKVATEKNKTQLLDELFQNDKDPTAFLRGGVYIPYYHSFSCLISRLTLQLEKLLRKKENSFMSQISLRLMQLRRPIARVQLLLWQTNR